MFVTQIQMSEDPNILFFNLIYGKLRFKIKLCFQFYTYYKTLFNYKI